MHNAVHPFLSGQPWQLLLPSSVREDRGNRDSLPHPINTSDQNIKSIMSTLKYIVSVVALLGTLGILTRYKVAVVE